MQMTTDIVCVSESICNQEPCDKAKNMAFIDVCLEAGIILVRKENY